MPKVAPGAYVYAVAKGRRPGVYLSWEDCEAQVTGFPGAKYRKFRARADSDAWLRAHGVGDGEVGHARGDAGADEHGHGDEREHARGDGHGHEPRTPTKPKTQSQSRSSTAEPSTPRRARPSPSPTLRRVAPTAAAPTTTPHEEEPRIVYCDGACRGNGRAGSVAGVGVFWGPGDVRNIAERCPGDQTNNRAELVAIARVLETTPVDTTPLVIRTDSKYSIQCLTLWLPKWRQTAWRTGAGTPVANRALISYVDALLEERRGAGQRVTLEHVYGHSGDAGNDGADAQANLGCTASPNLHPNPSLNSNANDADPHSNANDADPHSNANDANPRSPPLGGPHPRSPSLQTRTGRAPTPHAPMPDRDWAALEKAVRERAEEAAMWRAVGEREAVSGSGLGGGMGGKGKGREEEEEEAREPRTPPPRKFRPAPVDTPQFSSPGRAPPASSSSSSPVRGSRTPGTTETRSGAPALTEEEMLAYAACLGTTQELEAELCE